jgi:hypothetical protein
LLYHLAGLRVTFERVCSVYSVSCLVWKSNHERRPTTDAIVNFTSGTPWFFFWNYRHNKFWRWHWLLVNPKNKPGTNELSTILEISAG